MDTEMTGIIFERRLETGLASLPAELVRKVALFCPGNSLMALGRTCRRLHWVCNDFLVLRESVAIQLLDHASDDDADEVASTQLDALKQRARTDPAIWARYSVALGELSRLQDTAGRLSDRNGFAPVDDVQMLSRKMMAFMPQTLAIGCVEVLHRQAASLLTAVALMQNLLGASDSPFAIDDEATLSKLSFCFAAESMSRPNQSPDASDAGDDMLQRALSILAVGAPPLRDAFPSLSKALVNGIANYSGQFFHNSHTKYFLIGLISRALGALNDGPGPMGTPAFDNIVRLSLEHAPDLPLPFEPHLPLPKTDIPSPDKRWSDWLRLTETRFATRETLEGGDWRCYRSSDARLRAFRGPLDVCRFHVVDEDKTHIRVRSHGRQGGMAFGMTGIVAKSDGRFDLLQEYPGVHTCRWLGYLTPFGMVGYWQSAHVVHDPIGVFWMWRRSEEGGHRI